VSHPKLASLDFFILIVVYVDLSFDHVFCMKIRVILMFLMAD